MNYVKPSWKLFYSCVGVRDMSWETHFRFVLDLYIVSYKIAFYYKRK